MKKLLATFMTLIMLIGLCACAKTDIKTVSEETTGKEISLTSSTSTTSPTTQENLKSIEPYDGVETLWVGKNYSIVRLTKDSRICCVSSTGIWTDLWEMYSNLYSDNVFRCDDLKITEEPFIYRGYYNDCYIVHFSVKTYSRNQYLERYTYALNKDGVLSLICK